MSGRRRAAGGPELTVAFLVPAGRALPAEALAAARAMAEEVLVVGPASAPVAGAGIAVVPTLGRDRHRLTVAALGRARGRWTLLVRPGEQPHAPHPRTLARYLRHETAAGFFVPFNDRLPLLRVVPSAAARLWSDDPLPSQALLEAEPGRRLMASEGLSLAHGAGFAWPAMPTRPGDAWIAAVRALAAGRPERAARALARLEPEAARTPEAASLRGEIAFWRERWQEAEEAWLAARAGAVRAAAPAARAAAVGLGRLREARGNLEGARAAYLEALVAAPLDQAALARLLAVEWRLGASWPESVGHVLREHPWSWRGVGRALDRIVPAAAQLKALRSMPMAYGRDLLLARAALAAGDVALARRTLGRVESEPGAPALGYQVWLTELVGGSASRARSAAARCGELTPSGRLALLLAAGAVLGEPGHVPTLRSDEALEVGEWLMAILADLCLLRLRAQARALVRLVETVLGAVGAAQARDVVWRATRPTPSEGGRALRVRPVRAVALGRPGAVGALPWLSGDAPSSLREVGPWPPQ